MCYVVLNSLFDSLSPLLFRQRSGRQLSPVVPLRCLVVVNHTRCLTDDKGKTGDLKGSYREHSVDLPLYVFP